MPNTASAVAAAIHTSSPIHGARWLENGHLLIVSGPEKHTLGTPCRVRKVYAVRRYDVRTGIASGGFGWKKELEDAMGDLRSAR